MFFMTAEFLEECTVKPNLVCNMYWVKWVGLKKIYFI